VNACTKIAALAFCAAALPAAFSAAPASAEPVLGLELARTAAPATHSDERLAYEVKVKNAASANPSPGTELTCLGTPVDGKKWFGTPTPSFEVEWMRNGTPIPGTKAPAAATPKGNTYVVTAADQGKSLQCRVTGTNDADGAGTTYAPIAAATVSRPRVAVEPVSSPAPPSGTSFPTLGQGAGGELGTQLKCQAPTDWTGFAAATPTSGSNVLTNVRTTAGSGTLAKGSKVVKNVITTNGAFTAGQTITSTSAAGFPATGIPANTTISSILSPSELELSAAATVDASRALAAGAQPFAAGQPIEGFGIPAGTTIAAVEGQKLTLSANLTFSEAVGTIALWGPGIGGSSWSFRTLRNGEPIPGATSGTYTVQNADTEPPSNLQCEAIATDPAGNEAISISPRKATEPEPPSPYSSPAFGNGEESRPTLTFDNKSAGPISFEAEVPSGVEVLRASGNGWGCVKTPSIPSQPSNAKCTREDSLEPGATYPTLELVAQVAADAPDSLTTRFAVSGGGAAAPAVAEDTVSGILPAVPFGFKAFETAVLDELGDDYVQAGGHPFSAGASLQFNDHVKAAFDLDAKLRASNGLARVVRTELPPGLVGNPEALAQKCESVGDVLRAPSSCPAASAVGGITVETGKQTFENLPIWAIEPEYGTPAQFAFAAGTSVGEGFAYTLTPELRPDDGYAISLVSTPAQKNPELFGATAVLCGFGAKVGHHKDPGNIETEFKGCREASDPEADEAPFISLPTRCQSPASTLTEIFADTWEEPGNFAKAQFSAPDLQGCDALEFQPTLKARPTTSAADSPSGLEVDLQIPQNQDLQGTASSQLKKTVVTLPEGLVVNPAAANGLGACTPAQIGLGTNDPVGCPDSSKVGSVEVQTPILDHPLPGSLYVASPHENPFGSLLALYLVIDDRRSGILVKLPGRVDPDPRTGRLTTTFDDNPEAPVERVKLNIRGGAAAPLRTPALCGTYATASELTPWSAPHSGPPETSLDSYAIDQGPGGGACATTAADQPNVPAFKGASVSPIAGAYTPFVVDLRREDGSQQFSAVTVTPPPGLVAKLAGTATCPESALAAAAAKSGKAEQASPSCPAASEVGSAGAGVGAGPAPYNATGKAYLAPPYKGAPLSLAILTPAVAGPFDLGTIVTRVAVYVDPQTAQITAKSDPIPEILEGIPLDVRSVAVTMDRPQFTLNPTSCDPMAVSGQLLSTLGQSASLLNRFQVAECERLAFRPELELRLHGSTNRAAYQRLSATLTYPKGAGYANIASAAVTLPHSSFLAQEHINTICTRVQFAAHQCPKGSIYGKATAITPLLDQPLTGPVYLRSSSNPLPDLVVALRGPDSMPIEVDLVGRVDSKHGGIRNSFEVAPDAPVSKFTLQMLGGRKSLIVNSRDLCKGTQRATVRLGAQNGKSRNFRPMVRNDCRKAAKGKRGGP
jgi:hypothetical protein